MHETSRVFSFVGQLKAQSPQTKSPNNNSEDEHLPDVNLKTKRCPVQITSREVPCIPKNATAKRSGVSIPLWMCGRGDLSLFMRWISRNGAIMKTETFLAGVWEIREVITEATYPFLGNFFHYSWRNWDSISHDCAFFGNSKDDSIQKKWKYCGLNDSLLINAYLSIIQLEKSREARYQFLVKYEYAIRPHIVTSFFPTMQKLYLKGFNFSESTYQFLFL